MNPKNKYGTTIASTYVGKRKDDDGWEHHEWVVTLTREGQTRTLPYRMGTANEQTKCGKRKPQQMGRFSPSTFDVCKHQTCNTAGWQAAPPDLYSVLCSLKADDPQGESFADWCANYGYDTDSIKARETYFACQESEAASRKFFGADWPKIKDDEEYT